MTTYQLGDLLAIRDDDQVFDEVDAAVKEAVERSAKDDRRVFGVWTGQDEGSELLFVAHMGELFRK